METFKQMSLDIMEVIVVIERRWVVDSRYERQMGRIAMIFKEQHPGGEGGVGWEGSDPPVQPVTPKFKMFSTHT